MKKNKNNVLVFLLVLAIGLAVIHSEVRAAQSAMPGKINMGTAGTGGTYYVVGAGMASVIQKQLKIPVTAEVTAGAPENIVLMDSKEMTLGIISAEDADLCRKGQARYKKKYDIVAVTALYPNVTQPVVLAKSDIKTINDFKGKRVAVGAIGGGVYTMNKVLLGTLGIDIEKDIKPYPISFSEAATALKDGTIDATFQTTGAPASFLLEVEASHPIRIISLSEQEINTLLKNQLYYSRIVIPAGTYRSVKQEVKTIGSWALLACPAGLSTELVYQVTKSIFDNLNEIHGAHAAAKFIKPENLKAVQIPYHPGAIKYFEEKGYKYK